MAKNESYEQFIDKFKSKKTTDECYTPPKVYNTILQWVVKRFNLQNYNILRPFYPNGDYQSVNYSCQDVVIDNPPFSILSEICKYYTTHNIKFFLFCDCKTIFSVNCGRNNYIISDSNIIYENGARVKTGFVTNLGNDKIIISHELNQLIKKAQEDNKVKQLKYEYPTNLFNFSKFCQLANRGYDFSISANDCYWLRTLDSQRKSKKAIFGCGFLVSDKVLERIKQEKTAKEIVTDTKIKWELSENEKNIIKQLGGANNDKKNE